MKVKIYQITLNSGYAFMNYDYAKDILDIEDYELVAELEPIDMTDANKALDEIYWLGNDGTLSKIFRMRSISVSDIIEIDGIKYYVDSFGFKQI